MLSDDFDMDSSLVVSLISIVISMILVGVFIFSHFRTEYVDPGRPLSVRQCVCVCVCLCVCHSLSFPQILADVDENLTT